MKFSEGRKRTLRRATAIVLMVVGVGAFIYFYDNNLDRSFALLIVMFAALVVNPRQKPMFFSPRARERQQALAIRPWHWIVGCVLTGAAIAAFLWLDYDAMTGYKEVIPVYAFAASGFICVIWWAGLFARWTSVRS